MRWAIANYQFCEHQQQLTFDREEIAMAPITVELLAYFCRNPGVTISRDELINEVWSGRVVTDSAVNRAITKLRKLFNDDARKPQFIATFPKKGYRFIAPVTELNNGKDDQGSSSNSTAVSQAEHSPASSTLPQANSAATKAHIEDASRIRTDKMSAKHEQAKPLIYTVLICVMILLLMSYQLLQGDKNPTAFVRLTALTQEAGQEMFPAISPNQKYFSYSNINNNVMTSKIRDLESLKKIEITHNDYSHVWVGPVSWSKDGQLIVYTVTTKNQCMYFIREFNNFTLSKPRLIHNCNQGSAGKIQFLQQNHRLVFAESDIGGANYQLYELNLQSNTIRRLNQPEVVLSGNNQFDVHPFENKILISAPDKQQWENFYSLDVDTGELTKLFGLDAYICCGIWSHDGNEVVLMGEHPSKQVMAFDLQGNNKRVLLTNSEVIYRPQRHSNGKDYLVNLDSLNQDIHSLHLPSGQQSVLVNTTTDDRLGKRSPQQNLTAFISTVSEQEQIWLLDQTQGSKRPITNFTDNLRFLDLLWSPDGSTLAALTLNELYTIDMATFEVTKVTMAQSEIKGVSFADNRTLSFSRQIKGQWQVQAFNLDSQELILNSTQWQFIDHNSGHHQPLKMNRSGDLYLGERKASELQAITDYATPNRQFSFKYHNGVWYYLKYEYNKFVLYKWQDQQAHLVEKDITSFDLQGDILTYTKRMERGSNIYMTTSR